MTRSLDEAKKLFRTAPVETKLEYLFDMVSEIYERDYKVQVNACRKIFVTRTQAKIIAVVVFVAAVAFGVGAGYITVSEAISLAKP